MELIKRADNLMGLGLCARFKVYIGRFPWYDRHRQAHTLIKMQKILASDSTGKKKA